MFKMALDLTPSDRELCSQSTISRLENLPDVRALMRMGRAMVDLYCDSFAKVPKRIGFASVQDGGRRLRRFKASDPDQLTAADFRSSCTSKRRNRSKTGDFR
jgi:hypothetical protein